MYYHVGGGSEEGSKLIEGRGDQNHTNREIHTVASLLIRSEDNWSYEPHKLWPPC